MHQRRGSTANQQFRTLRKMMRRKLVAVAGAAFGLLAAIATANAYEFDILTHLPLMPGRMAQDGRPQAQAVPRETVGMDTKHKAGTIIISTGQRRLYYTLGDGTAIAYGVGVGRPGFEWSGTKVVSQKREWPSWTPPSQMLRRRPDLPRHMAGGLNNPLGARAMYLGSSLYRIHGSNEPETIGQAVSSGCIRMTNDDVIDLYNRVRVGTRVVVMR
jgi:lipoprotein-anchoring transpeptidase ErfK/SrfK